MLKVVEATEGYKAHPTGLPGRDKAFSTKRWDQTWLHFSSANLIDTSKNQFKVSQCMANMAM